MRRFLCLSLLSLAPSCGGRVGSGSGEAPEAPEVQPTSGGALALGGVSGGGATTAGPSIGGRGGATMASSDAKQWLEDVSGCVTTVELDFSPEQIRILVDTSASMQRTSPTVDLPAWEWAKAALTQAILDPSVFPAHAEVGMLLAPNRADFVASATVSQPIEACMDLSRELSMPILGWLPSEERQRLIEGLAEATIAGGMPLYDAYSRVTGQFFTGILGLLYDFVQYVVVVTDGMPTLQSGCRSVEVPGANTAGWPPPLLDDGPYVDPTDLSVLVEQARSAGIRTLFVGVPFSEAASPWLSKAAVTGGASTEGCDPGDSTKPCHVDMAYALSHGLDPSAVVVEALRRAFACRYALPDTMPVNGSLEPLDLTQVTPAISYSDLSFEVYWDNNAAPADCDEGYRFVSPSEIQLCPSTCKRLMRDAGATFFVVLGCPPSEWAKQRVY